jgi:hypothetical protein
MSSCFRHHDAPSFAQGRHEQEGGLSEEPALFDVIDISVNRNTWCCRVLYRSPKVAVTQNVQCSVLKSLPKQLKCAKREKGTLIVHKTTHKHYPWMGEVWRPLAGDDGGIMRRRDYGRNCKTN